MILLLLPVLAAAVAQPEALATIRVGLDPRGAPWAFVPGRDYMKEDLQKPPKLTPAQLDRLDGLDLDVIRALERRLAQKLEIVPTWWQNIEEDLIAGRYDVILNAWTPNPKTPPEIVASEPYYEWGLVVAVRAADARIRTVPDLAERAIGHIPDPTVLPALRAMGVGLGAKMTVVQRGGEELFERLGRREFDAIVFDSAYVRWRVARDPAFRIVGEPLNRLGYHVGVRAKDKALLEKFQAAVRDFVASPEAASIRRKWESAGTPAP